MRPSRIVPHLHERWTHQLARCIVVVVVFCCSYNVRDDVTSKPRSPYDKDFLVCKLPSAEVSNDLLCSHLVGLRYVKVIHKRRELHALHCFEKHVVASWMLCVLYASQQQHPMTYRIVPYLEPALQRKDRMSHCAAPLSGSHTGRGTLLFVYLTRSTDTDLTCTRHTIACTVRSQTRYQSRQAVQVPSTIDLNIDSNCSRDRLSTRPRLRTARTPVCASASSAIRTLIDTPSPTMM